MPAAMSLNSTLGVCAPWFPGKTHLRTHTVDATDTYSTTTDTNPLHDH